MAITIRKTHQLTGHNAGIYALLPGMRPGTFLSAAGDGWLVEWELANPETGKLVAKVDTQVFSMAYLPATNTLVAGDMNGGVHWLNLSEERPNKHIAHHQKGVFGILPLGDYVYTIGGGGVLTRWDAITQRSSDSLHLSAAALRSIAYDEGDLLVGSSDAHIYHLAEASLAVQNSWKAHDNSVFALAFANDGSHLFSGSRDAHLKVWNRTGDDCLSSQPAHLYTINDIKTLAAEGLMATASRDRTIKLWDATNFKLLKVLDAARDGGHVNSVNRLCWLPDERILVSASDDRTIILWQLD